MSALASLLARDAALPVGKVQEAIQEQVVSGGNLDTVILELGLLQENIMSAYCAAVYGMLPATRTEVMSASRDVTQVLTREFAVRNRFVPIASTQDAIVIALDRPLALRVLDEIQTELRVFPAQRIVTTARLQAAFHEFYGVELTARMRRLLEWLNQQPAGEVPYVAPLDGGGIRSPHPPRPEQTPSQPPVKSIPPVFSDPPRRSMPVVDRDDTPLRATSSIPAGTFRDSDPVRASGPPLKPRVAGRYSWRPAAMKETLGTSSHPPPKSHPPSKSHPPPKWRPSARPARHDRRRDNDGTGVVHDVVRLGAGTPSEAPRNADTDPPQRRVKKPSRPPVPSNASVIVDMGESVEEIIDELWDMSPEDDTLSILPILGVGEAALPVLVQEFPGPLWFDRRRPHVKLPAGRNISPIARALVAFGDRAVPYLITLLDHKDANTRYYATLLASEFVHRKLVAPVGRRLFDGDPQTRTVAYRALAGLRACPAEFEEFCAGLRTAARVPRDTESQLIAIDALGRLRDVASIPIMTPLLDVEHDDVVRAAHASLVRLTCQDFGDARRKWDSWYSKHLQEHRIEWLIAALDHDDARIRRRASDELKHLTQVYFGFHQSLSAHDRQVVQRKYRNWWTDEGSRIFVGDRA